MAERSVYNVCLSDISMFFIVISEMGWSEAWKESMVVEGQGEAV